MLNQIKKTKDNQKGFTIIEVLIVLAIAGLILLIVFLAVPALQRNSRNTQRKSDISALTGAINEFTSNNGGTAPTVAQLTGGGAAINNAKLGFYNATANVFAAAIPATGGGTTTIAATGSGTVLSLDSVIVYSGADCSAGTNAAAVKGSARSVAIEYLVENSGTGVAVCDQS